MYGALKQGLDRVDFFKARKPESVMRVLRTVLGRTELDAHEARLLRSIGYEIRNWVDRLERVKPGSSGDADDTGD